MAQFTSLLIGHAAGSSPEATLVLAARAAFGGLRSDNGADMPNAEPRIPTLRELADELGLSLDAVRRGDRELLGRGELVAGIVGPVVVRDALIRRWFDHRRRIRLPAAVRALRLRPTWLLLAGLVHGQIDRRAQFRAGVPVLAERLGLSPRRVRHALDAVRRHGVIGSHLIPGRWLLVLSPTLSIGQSSASLDGQRGPSPDGQSSGDLSTMAPLDGHAASPNGHASVVRRSPERSVVVTRASSDGQSNPDYGLRIHPDARARRAQGDTSSVGSDPKQIRRAAVEQFVAAFVRLRIERFTDAHAPEVAGLIDELGPRPENIRDRRAFARSRLELAQQVIRWCPSPERLARWLVRVDQRFGVENLAALLRRASGSGDPGTVLESDAKNRTGRAVETWRDFSPAVERELEGEHLVAVAQLSAGVAEVLASESSGERDRLRLELRRLWLLGRQDGARRVLLRLVGSDRSDIGLARAVAGICTVADARRLVA